MIEENIIFFFISNKFQNRTNLGEGIEKKKAFSI